METDHLSGASALGPHIGPRTLAKLVSQKDANEAVAAALRDVEAGRLEQPPRLVVGDGQLLVMTALDRRTRDAIVKTLTIYDIDGKRQIEGSAIWYGGATGLPQFSVDAHGLTALRTGAVSAVATDVLAPPDVRHLAILGSGAQARTQLDACCEVRAFDSVSVFSRTSSHAEAFASAARLRHPGIDIVVAPSANSAVRRADVVCCATGSDSPLFDLEALPSSVHVNAVGSFRPSMAELPAGLIEGASAVVLDDIAGCLEGSGEVRSALDNGLRRSDLVSLGASLAAPGQRGSRTVFKSVGCAALDWAVANKLAERLGGTSTG